MISEFNLPRLERVVSGAGSAARVGAELDRLRATRVVIVTGRTLGASPLLESLKRAIGDRCVSVFDRVRQHVPSETVDELLNVVAQEGADGVVSFGGGSAIDTAKLALSALCAERGDISPPREGKRRGVVALDLPHLAIPTTLSAGEFTSVAGITDEETRIKRPVHDARIAPRVVIADPLLTPDTPELPW